MPSYLSWDHALASRSSTCAPLRSGGVYVPPSSVFASGFSQKKLTLPSSVIFETRRQLLVWTLCRSRSNHVKLLSHRCRFEIGADSMHPDGRAMAASAPLTRQGVEPCEPTLVSKAQHSCCPRQLTSWRKNKLSDSECLFNLLRGTFNINDVNNVQQKYSNN